MEVLRAVLLALLLCGQSGPGCGQAPEEDADDMDLGPDSYGYDDDDEEDEETNVAPGTERLQCYFCQSLHRGENCTHMQSCPRNASCITLISHGNTDSGFLTTYSMWCVDTCQPIIKTVDGTQMTKTCCQSTLCNVPPWQRPQIRDPLGGRAGSPQDGGAGHPKGGRAGSSQDGRAGHPQEGEADSPQDSGTGHPQGGGAGHPQDSRPGHPRSGGAGHPQGGKAGSTQDSGTGHPQGSRPGHPQSGGAGRPQGGRAGGPLGCPQNVGTALLLSLLTNLWATGA
ncbi:glycosylphosphatidylinositol-anchored high density lipoprotein-binding protein 1 [Urocitellus parryii]|uniref:Snake toxin/toxin-like domain-containing protein n=1 Tax=Urocitellus parryii TaxID=9999 RepID=A0A8D2KPV3_UROPR|nr:glycosylphosphatidylinositol-anchored high density lipoprotein-binding protein 1 [Urocitellus parryii]